MSRSFLSTGDNTPTILIIDDSPENLVVLGELLQPHYRVRAASSGLRGLQVAHTAPRPDLILLDVMMPQMDGYEVLLQLQRNPLTQDIPVIFITALDGTDDEQKGFDLGAVDYISKPMRPAIVLSRVRAHLELKRSRDWLRDQNSYLEAEVRRRMEENQLIQDISMRALASLAETRDNETGNHIRRTQSYVDILAQALCRHPRFAHQLDARAIDLIVKAAPLHDIGKVGIPDQILLKPGPLTPQEWDIMKTHCRVGSEAIESAMRGVENHAPLAFLHIAIDIAYSHHEKWDGSGYPDGLAGDHIPLPARLMAVADVFDAIITRRAYKPAMPISKAREIILEGRGHHFDPDIVDAFELHFPDLQTIAERFEDDPPLEVLP